MKRKSVAMRSWQALVTPVVAFATIASGTAWAQTPVLQEFTVQRFEPAPGPNNFLGVQTLRMEGEGQWSAGLFFNYARDPFTVHTCTSPTTCADPAATNKRDTHVVRDMFTTDLLFAISPKPWLQLGLRLPVTYVSGDGLNLTTGGALAAPLQAVGLGDPYLEAKVRVVNLGNALAVGLGGDIAFAAHASDATNFIGNSSPVTGGVRAILDGSVGGFFYGGNLRALLRKDVSVGLNQGVSNTVIGPEMRYGLAAGYRLSPAFEMLAEGFGGTGFRSAPGTNSLEVDGAIRYRVSNSLTLTVGGGAGVVQGVGVPAGRAFLGLSYGSHKGDQDHDGIPDDADKCPTVAEDVDGFEDWDGCPEPDNDQDQIPDAKDQCPNTRENKNGFQDDDGCPDEAPDRDHDGVGDSVDKCPDAGGSDIIKNAKNPYFGCPDRDHDGVPDHLDKCPDVAEATDDLWDGSGCPHVRDSDGDGIPDDVDQCPNEPETYNGFKDDDGCPDTGPTAVEIKDGTIAIHDRIEFATNRDVIQGGKSLQVLDAVASVMKGHKEILRVEVQGHTDGVGPAEQNRKLSAKRAAAVVKYLVSKGVDTARLVPQGYGPDTPIGNNKTVVGRAQNRRVEFHILESARKGPAASSPPKTVSPP